jgi:hypothetical protein
VTSGQRWTRLAAAAHVLSLVGGFLILLNCNKDQWFFGDEWDFLGHRGVFRAERSLWAPHTEHWSTGPILIYRALYSRYGLLSYMPYVVVLLVLHLAVAHFLWRLLRQAGVDPLLSAALASVYVLLGAGYENLLWAFQIGFIGSVAFGMAALVLVNHAGRWGARDVSAWFLSVAGLMFSGIGVTMAAVAGLTVLMRRGARQALLTLSVPAIVYLVWFFLVGDSAVESTKRTWDDVYKYPEYIWTGLRSAFEATVGFPGAGAIVVLALAAFLFRRAGHASGPAAPAFACAVGALLLFAIIATGRAGLGVEQAEASRYTYIVLAFAVPGIGLALGELAGQGPLVVPRRPVEPLSGALGGNPAPSGPPVPADGGWGGEAGAGRRLVLCFVLAMVAVHNGGILADQSKIQKRLEQRLKARILAADELATSPAVILGGNPEPEYNPDIVLADLRRMHRDGKLPAPTRITDDDRITVAGILQYATSPTALAVPFIAAPVDGVVGASVDRDPAGCLHLLPTGPVVELHLAGGDPISVRLTTTVSADLMGYLRIFTPKVLTGEPHVDKLRAGVPVYVNVTAAVDQVVLRLPPSGTTVVCGVE